MYQILCHVSTLLIVSSCYQKRNYSTFQIVTLEPPLYPSTISTRTNIASVDVAQQHLSESEPCQCHDKSAILMTPGVQASFYITQLFFFILKVYCDTSSWFWLLGLWLQGAWLYEQTWKRRHCSEHCQQINWDKVECPEVKVVVSLLSFSSRRSQTTSDKPFSYHYNYYDSNKHSDDYLYSMTQDVFGNWKHFNISADTLNFRNLRSKSPMVTRELNR